MTTKEFLKGHPLLSASSIETALGLTRGTIRLMDEKPLKEDVDVLITPLLMEYGYKPEDNSPMVVKKSRYFTRQSGKRENRECTIFFRNDEDNIDRRAFFPDGTMVYLTDPGKDFNNRVVGEQQENYDDPFKS